MFPKKYPDMPKGNWKASLPLSPTSTIKLSPKDKKLAKTQEKGVETAKPKTKRKNKNTKREISKKTAEEVRARDKFCIIPKCGMLIDEMHHAFYWIAADYSPNRNKVNQLVGLCKSCHDKLHSRWGNEYRQFCKDYLKQYAQV